jgi:hypothetical protein
MPAALASCGTVYLASLACNGFISCENSAIGILNIMQATARRKCSRKGSKKSLKRGASLAFFSILGKRLNTKDAFYCLKKWNYAIFG